MVGAVETPQRWTCDEFRKLPRETVTVDIHSITDPALATFARPYLRTRHRGEALLESA